MGGKASLDDESSRRVTIVGCGLIGGSLALALKRRSPGWRVAGWDSSPAVLEHALARRIIDEVDEAFQTRGVSTSNLIYLAMPVAQIVEFLRARSAQFAPRTIITDAGSTKVEVCRAAREHLPPNVIFIGGHPVAGSHHAGVLHARADLFDDAPYVLTPFAEDEACDALSKIIVDLGARIYLTTPGEHDRALAYVSHLPQLLSSALAATVGERADADSLAQLSGPGYRDMTRLAHSSWSVWGDILATNRGEVAAALDAYIERLARVRDELRGEIELNYARSLFPEDR
jgi:prephenate dehydrogenase